MCPSGRPPPDRDNDRMSIPLPAGLVASCRKSPERAAWLRRLPAAVGALESAWSLTLGPPFDSQDVSCAWVAPARLADGTSAVLKIGMPHMEAEHEMEGLRFWNGDPAVRVLLADPAHCA